MSSRKRKALDFKDMTIYSKDDGLPVGLDEIPLPASGGGLARPRNPPKPKLEWLVDDFNGITGSVYEAAMVAALRARQVGRLQKHEIDNWNSAHDIAAPPTGAPSEEPGVDNFNHQKPTVQALDELKDKQLTYSYSEQAEK